MFLVDEPLFLIHHIDIMVSVTGSNLLQNIKESLQLPPEYEIIHNPETGKDEVGFIMFNTLLQSPSSSLLNMRSSTIQRLARMRWVQLCFLPSPSEHQGVPLQLPPEYEIIHNPETGKDEVGSIMLDTLLQNIKEPLQLPPEYEIIHNPETGKDEVGSVMFDTLLQNILGVPPAPS